MAHKFPRITTLESARQPLAGLGLRVENADLWRWRAEGWQAYS